METTTEIWERRGQAWREETAAGWPEGGEGQEGGGLPFDPRAPKMLSGQTLPENPSWIPPHSSLCWAGFTASWCCWTLFMAAPFSSPHLQAPKASGPAKGGLWGQGSPPQSSLPILPLNPAGCRKEGAGWAPKGPLPGSLQSVWEEEEDPQA